MPQKCIGGLGSAPDHAGGAYCIPPDLLAGFEGATLQQKGRQGEGRGWEGSEEGGMEGSGGGKEIRRGGRGRKEEVQRERGWDEKGRVEDGEGGGRKEGEWRKGKEGESHAFEFCQLESSGQHKQWNFQQRT